MCPPRPKAPKPPKIPKPKPHEIIRRLISGENFSGKQGEWAREGKSLKRLRERIPDDGFWRVVTFPFKPDSLVFFLGTKGLDMVDRRYKEYKYIPPPLPEPPKLGQVIPPDHTVEPRKSLFDLLS